MTLYNVIIIYFVLEFQRKIFFIVVKPWKIDLIVRIK